RRPARRGGEGLLPRVSARRGRCTRRAPGRPAAPPCLRSPAVPRPGPGRCRSCVPLAHRLVLLRPARPERRTDRPTLKNERASPAARTAGPKKATKPFTGILAAVRPSRQLDRRRFRCGLRHVARPRVVPYHTRPKTGVFSRHWPTSRRASELRYNGRSAYRARYDKPIRGTVPRTVPRSGAACGQHPAEQERDAPLGLRPDLGVQFDGLEQRALDPVAVFGEVPADAFGGVAGGGVRDDALRAPVG